MERRLAAIFALDVVGYTRLIRADEEGTLAGLKALRQDVVDPKIAAYNGRVVKLMGDGMLAEFPSVVDAVRAAAEVQREVAGRNAGLPQQQRIEFRVGINLGDVVIDGEDIHGDGVNVAARLEGLADPGGICVSGNVYDEVRHRTGFSFEVLRNKTVKNIDEPMDVYKVLLESRDDARATPLVTEKRRPLAGGSSRMALAAGLLIVIVAGGIMWWLLAPTPDSEVRRQVSAALPDSDISLAVMPFSNFSKRETERLFAKGLTEDLETMLGRMPGFLVVASSAVRKLVSKDQDVRKTAGALNVKFLVTGSIDKSGDRLRVSARLVEGRTGVQIWSDRYDRNPAAIFEVRDEIVRNIMTELQVTLKYGEHARIAGRGTKNLEAWLLRLQAWEAAIKLTRDGVFRARKLFERARAADPTWARPVAGLSWTYREALRRRWSTSRSKDFKLGVELAKQAIKMDPLEPAGYIMLGNLYVETGRFKEGIALREKAFELAPNDIASIVGLAWNLQWIGEVKRSIALYEHAKRVSPHLPATSIAAEAFARHQVGETELAIALYRRSLAKVDRSFTRVFLAAAYADIGEMDKASAEIKRILRKKPDARAADFMGIIKFKDPSRTKWIRDLIIKAGLPE